MKIVCDGCGAKYSIADEKVAGKIFKIRCKKCSSVLEVRGDRTGANALDDPNAAQGPSDATWYIVVDGEQKGPLAPIDLSQLFAKGSVGLGSYVWAEGFADWKLASDVPELAQLFGGATSQASGADAPSDQTSAIAAGGDLFGRGDDREPTAEIDTNSSMFAGFEDNPTPTPAAEDSPLAAAAREASESMASGGAVAGGAMAGAAPQRMTGQRNENSVLFSLSNLQQLASRGGPSSEDAPAAAQPAAPTAGAASTPPTTSEGSGLIDIRALAKSTGPGTQKSSPESVDDLLAIGSGGGAALGGPLLGPTPDDSSEGNRWLWIGGVAIAVFAIVGAGVWVGTVIGGSDQDALEISAEAGETLSPAVATGSGATAETPTEPPSEPIAAAQPVEATGIEDNAPEEAPSLETPTSAKKRPTSTTTRRPRTAKTTSSTKTASAAPAPKKRGSKNLDALMDEVVGGSSSTSKPKQTRTSSTSTSSNLPDAPSRGDVKTALQGVSGAVKACRKDAGGTATVNVTFSGKTGRATGAKVASGPFKGTPVGSCIESAVKRARVPRFKQSSFKVTFPYRL